MQTAMATKIVPKLCESLLRTPPKGRALLIQWLAECPIDILAARLVRPIQSFITEKMKRDNALSGAVIYAIELLAVVNEAELSKPAGVSTA